MVMVGIRELKAHLSAYLRRVKKGDVVGITEHGEPVATLAPALPRVKEDWAWQMVQAGEASWEGGKPRGAKEPIRLKGKPLSESILEDRSDRF